jgi:hypothetical protein
MSNGNNLMSAGLDVVRRNLRYLLWFYLLSLLFAGMGALGFGMRAHEIMDHSLYSDRLLHGFHAAVLVEMMNRPEFGAFRSSRVPAEVSGNLFVLLSLVFMPGVLLGYSSDHRISREEFFRTCGRNLGRFVRLFLVAAVIVGIVGSLAYFGSDPLADAAEKTNYEMLPFLTNVACWVIAVLILTKIRLWFDLAQTDVVLRDQAAVRKSLATGLRMMRKNWLRLLGTYVAITLLAVLVLAGGIVLWNLIVPSSSLLGALLISQLTAFLFLGARFWQRATAVAFYVKQMAEPVVETAGVPAAAVVS